MKKAIKLVFSSNPFFWLLLFKSRHTHHGTASRSLSDKTVTIVWQKGHAKVSKLFLLLEKCWVCVLFNSGHTKPSTTNIPHHTEAKNAGLA